MSNENKTQKPSIIKSLLIAFAVLAGIIVCILVFGMIKLPGWPFCFFFFYCLTFTHKLLNTAIGGFIGLTVGFSHGLFSTLIGNDGIGWLGTVILLIVLVTIVVDGRIKVIDPLCMMMVTVLTSSGLYSTTPEAFLPSVCSYAIAAVGFAIVVNVISSAHRMSRSISSVDKKNII